MEIKIVKDQPVTRNELKEIAAQAQWEAVKAVVDIEQEIMAIGGVMHAEEEVQLMEVMSSKRDHTWGVNLYPGRWGDTFVEFDSMVNLKVWLGNRTRSVESEEIRLRIKTIIQKLVSD
ncbi:MAG: hypothetical protein Greene071421_540 [Parcubacteria group bacterium Greene0714_21]|nr:MAG: hypothetical protein Greene041639_550 [Parcubacteria group bacterium Greene0416_39]TSC97651.1 MAG: hypothetical protein Greene101447_398 [Parcubacteria group bacterium Greene1014_47]TSD03881.1 MAG: hypothetical protein Greene071421_540 [Parcubacteria group bacterium Greene0714_21]